MRRSLHVAAVLLACAALAPACLLNSNPYETEASGGTGGTPTTSVTSSGGGGSGGTGGEMSVCGDGLLGGSEQCDDMDIFPGDGCGADCKIEAGWACGGEPSVCDQTCGDGKLDTGEDCDDGDIDIGDGCNQGCQIEKGWECGTSAPSLCHESCGDGTLDAGETCDDTNKTPEDGCDAQCKAEPGWKCEQPNSDPNQPSTCMTTCGDGIVAGTEKCDDGDTDDTNGCKADCSDVNPGWDCPGGGPTCMTVCGDGLPVGDEECDDGGMDAYDGCSDLCKLEHTCGNGVVDPGETCDGGSGCTMCALAPASVCGKAFVVPPGDEDPTTLVRTSYYDNATDAAGVAVALTDVPSQSCDSSVNLPVLHSYTTGKRPSIVTIEALETTLANVDTFDNTVLWVYRNCPGKSDLEACDNDGAPDGKHSRVRTGFIPAQTTLFIVISGEGGGGNDKGIYQLKVTEQPVKLFFHEDFGAEKTPGAYALPADLSLNVVGAGGEWTTCVAGVGSPCIGTNVDSHSGGAFGFGYQTAMDGVTTTATLTTPKVNLSGLQLARAQYTFVFNHGIGSDSGAAIPYDDTTPDMGAAQTHTTTSSGRTFVNLPKSAKAGMTFVYDDGTSSSAGKFSVDDIIIYGY